MTGSTSVGVGIAETMAKSVLRPVSSSWAETTRLSFLTTLNVDQVAKAGMRVQEREFGTGLHRFQAFYCTKHHPGRIYEEID